MSDKETVITDPPEPKLDELQDRNLPLPTVPVEIDGTVLTHVIPATRSSAEAFAMDVTPRAVMRSDPKRSRVVLVSTVAWQYSRTASGQKAPIPANVVITLTHCDDIFASVPTSTGVLAVITESYAD